MIRILILLIIILTTNTIFADQTSHKAIAKEFIEILEVPESMDLFLKKYVAYFRSTLDHFGVPENKKTKVNAKMKDLENEAKKLHD